MDNALKFDKVDARQARQVQPGARRPGHRSWPDRATAAPKRAKFQKRDAEIKKIIDRKARHAISLNEEKFKAESGSEEENKDEAKAKTKGPKKRLSDHPAWESNYYNDEVLSIVGDYLSLGRNVLVQAPKRVPLD